MRRILFDARRRFRPDALAEVEIGQRAASASPRLQPVNGSARPRSRASTWSAGWSTWPLAAQDGELAYDHLVLALGAMTNQKMIPGSENAFTFKTLADAFLLRNHMIECFERADVEPDPDRKRRLLTFVVIGGGLVGVELFGELTAFVDEITPLYRHVSRDEVRFLLLQAGDRIMPEIDPKLADYGAGCSASGAGRRSEPTPPCGPSSRARSTCRTRRSRRRPLSWQPGLSRTRSWPACPWRRTNAGTSWSMGPCAARATRRCGRSAIVR